MTSRRTGFFRDGSYQLANRSPGLWSLVERLLVRTRKTRLELCRPGMQYGPSPIRPDISDTRSWLDRVASLCLTYRERRRYTESRSSAWLGRLSLRSDMLKRLTPRQLDTNRSVLVRQMRHASSSPDLLDDALAHALIAAEKTRHLVPRANQRLAARALLRGHCVEMATGEGKTLSIALAAGAAALSGTPVHVLTANDYLAARDASYLEPVYRFLGLRVASVVAGQEPAERRHSYAADIVYVTAKQAAFDWLSDALELGSDSDSVNARLSVLSHTLLPAAYSPKLRGLCLAIVDEADSLLVDEARIPLVLAEAQRHGDTEKTEAAIALGLAELLRDGIDYTVLSTSRLIQLTDDGRAELSKLSRDIAHAWQSTRYREERVAQALTALHRFERDRDYIVRDGRLALIDAHTGRAMPDRRLPHGLQRLLEMKEKCTPSPQHATIATLPFQHFFRHYIGLVGISGTLNEVAGEIHRVYRSLVVDVPSHFSSRRTDLPALVLQDRSTQLQTMVDVVRHRQESGQPVLVCTRSVEQSLGVAATLTAHGIGHQVLNAYQDAEEAEIVAKAGQVGEVTVATNMAGRGTDIPLGSTVPELGGLHVVSLAFNDARRLDRQLAGRAARQGDPGSWQQLPSLDDPYLIEAMPEMIHKCARTCVDRDWQRAAMMLIRCAQIGREWTHRKERLSLFQSRKKLERRLAFGGKPDRQS